jgi:hypothetical protein
MLRFTHPAQVHVLRLPADAGVRLRYAESAELNLRLLEIPVTGGAAAASDASRMPLLMMLI